jgi:TnpA family transposase
MRRWTRRARPPGARRGLNVVENLNGANGFIHFGKTLW